MFYRVGQIIESRVAVNFVIGGVEKGFGVFGGGVDVGGFDDPDAHAFVAAGIDVAGVFNRHLHVGGVEAADVFVAETLFRADEYFPKWPVFHVNGYLLLVVGSWLIVKSFDSKMLANNVSLLNGGKGRKLSLIVIGVIAS